MNYLVIDQGKVFEKLIYLSKLKGLEVKFASLQCSYGRIKGNRVVIANDIGLEKINYTLAHELAHAYLHHDKGDILHGDASYEEQADRAATMLLDAIGLNERKFCNVSI